MEKETFISVLESVLGPRDRYGHFVSPERDMRVKIQRISWRFERRSGDRWIRIFGNYFGETEVTTMAKIIRRFNKRAEHKRAEHA